MEDKQDNTTAWDVSIFKDCVYQFNITQGCCGSEKTSFVNKKYWIYGFKRYQCTDCDVAYPEWIVNYMKVTSELGGWR